MVKDVIIIGAGGHAAVVIDTVSSMDKFNIIGITDKNEAKKGELLLDRKILGTDEILDGFSCEKIYLINGIGSFGFNNLHKRIYEKYISIGYTFIRIQHSSAVVSDFADISNGVQIMAGVVIQPGCKIGNNVIINTRASIDHDCIISDHVHIAPGAVLCGNVFVGNNTLVGAGAIILPGIKIGENCIIGAGAVILEDMADNMKAKGIPARSSKYA